MQRLVRCLVIRGDLTRIDAYLLEKGIEPTVGILLLKQAILGVAQTRELELESRSLYQKHRDLSEHFRVVAKEAEFFQYLRNKMVGHVKADLIEKTLEWKPETVVMLSKDSDLNRAGFAGGLFWLVTRPWVQFPELHRSWLRLRLAGCSRSARGVGSC